MYLYICICYKSIPSYLLKFPSCVAIQTKAQTANNALSEPLELPSINKLSHPEQRSDVSFCLSHNYDPSAFYETVHHSDDSRVCHPYETK